MVTRRKRALRRSEHCRIRVRAPHDGPVCVLEAGDAAEEVESQPARHPHQLRPHERRPAGRLHHSRPPGVRARFAESHRSRAQLVRRATPSPLAARVWRCGPAVRRRSSPEASPWRIALVCSSRVSNDSCRVACSWPIASKAGAAATPVLESRCVRKPWRFIRLRVAQVERPTSGPCLALCRFVCGPVPSLVSSRANLPATPEPRTHLAAPICGRRVHRRGALSRRSLQEECHDQFDACAVACPVSASR